MVTEPLGAHSSITQHDADIGRAASIAPMRDTQISHLRSRNIMSVQFFTQFSQVHGSYRWGRPGTLVGAYQSG